MKHKDLVDHMEKAGAVFVRNGSNHDIYQFGDKMIPIPRHKEINEILANSILKQCKIK